MRCARSVRLHRAWAGAGAGPGGRRRRRVGVGGGSCGYGRGLGVCSASAPAPAGTGAAAAPAALRRGRLGLRQALGAGHTRAAALGAGGDRPAVRPAGPPGGPPGGAPGLRGAPGWLLALACGGNGVDHRPDVRAAPSGPRLRASLLSLPGHGDDQVVAVDDDLGAGDTEAVDAGADDLLRLVQRVAGRPRPVGGARGQRDAGAALQVDAELGLGLLVAGQEHQQVDADEQDQEKRQVAVQGAPASKTMPRFFGLLEDQYVSTAKGTWWC